MKTRTITDNLIQLTRYGLVNAYLVRENDGFTLVDTGLPGAAEDYLAAARASGGEIRRIALTHGHGDHVGSLDALRARLGADVEVSMGELDARIHAGEKVVDGKLTGQWPTLETTPDVRLHDGDLVGSLRVLDSPGHSPGHVAFLDTRDDALIAGDVFATIGGPAVTNTVYWRFPLPGFATFDGERDLASARTLRALDPSVLVVGHGRAVPSPAAAMDAAIARAAR